MDRAINIAMNITLHVFSIHYAYFSTHCCIIFNTKTNTQDMSALPGELELSSTFRTLDSQDWTWVEPEEPSRVGPAGQELWQEAKWTQRDRPGRNRMDDPGSIKWDKQGRSLDWGRKGMRIDI